MFSAFHALADRSYFANSLLVCAANNVSGPSYPSLFASVLSVAAHDVADPETWFYNPSPPVEFGAHGVDVDVAWHGGGRIRATATRSPRRTWPVRPARLRSRYPTASPSRSRRSSPRRPRSPPESKPPGRAGRCAGRARRISRSCPHPYRSASARRRDRSLLPEARWRGDRQPGCPRHPFVDETPGSGLASSGSTNGSFGSLYFFIEPLLPDVTAGCAAPTIRPVWRQP